MRKCIGEHPKAITVSEWNEERKRHHDLARTYFERHLALLCDNCRAPIIFQEHYWFDANYPYRQIVCSSVKCGKSSYVMA